MAVEPTRFVEIMPCDDSKEHTSFNCWCLPTVAKPCPEHDAKTTCYKCGEHGLVAPDDGNQEDDLMIIHNSFDQLLVEAASNGG